MKMEKPIKRKIEDKKVKDIMTYGAITIPDDSKVIDVVRILVEAHVHGVVVTNEKNEPLGAVSEIDIPKAFGRDFSEVKVTEIMSSPVKTISMEKTVKEAGEIMRDKHVHRLIVVDENNRIRGILSVTDIIKGIYNILYNI